MALLIGHPELAVRTCEECKKWVYREDGTPVMSRGKKISRPINSLPSCFDCPKCVGKSKNPEMGAESDLSERNQLTIQRYFEYLVVPNPTDDIMRRNFGIIRRIIDSMEWVDRKLTITLSQLGVKHGGA